MKKSLSIFVVLLVLSSLQALAQSRAWRIEHAEWTPGHEAQFEKFVTRIGEAVAAKTCRSVTACLLNPAVNPYFGTDPKELKLYADCADWPFYLRAYFAWKNQLPFGFVKSLRPNLQPDEEVRDIRYTKRGNIVTGRSDILTHQNADGSYTMVDAVEFLNRTLPNSVSSATLRIGYVGMDAEQAFSDFYPVRINLIAVRPGTVVYDPAGHVIVIYKITADGRALFMDAHPDNSLTSGMFDARFSRSNPGQGAGFKNWRPLKLSGAVYDATYGLIGGAMTGAKDGALENYNLEQFFGTNAAIDWKKSEFAVGGKKMDFYSFVRNRLATGTLHINPLDDMRASTQQLCSTAKERVDAVQNAVSAGIHLQAHPDRLPKNIFGTEGDWETYASPSRDARLKDSFRQLRVYVENTVTEQRAGARTVVYKGTNIARDLYDIYRDEALKCTITYADSDGRAVSMNLEQLRSRIYDLSFDPYHCPELRWGARPPELNSCRDDETKRAWYSQERWMRFQHERNLDAKMDYDLQELTGPLDFGAAQGQDTDIAAWLKRKF